MRQTHVRLATVLALGLVAIVQAADINGKWTAQVPGRDGQMRETTFAFTAKGEAVSGTMTTPRGETAISNGKLAGDQLTFDVTMNFQGNEVVLHFKGAVAGDEIKFTRQREGSDTPQQFTATRAK